MNSKKTFDTSVTDFKEFIDKKLYYVDKTHFIKDLINANGLKINLMLRPHLFGRSLNLSMVKYFFDMKEKENSYLFDNLQISEDKDFCEKFQNKFPVIYVSFKDVKGNNFEQMLASLNKNLAGEYERHSEVQEIIYEEIDKKMFNRFRQQKAELFDFQFYLYELTTALYKYYKIKPIILIDDYELPLVCAFQNNYLDKVLTTFQLFISSTLKDFPYTSGAIVMGNLRTIDNGYYDGFNNPFVDHVGHHVYYHTAFGFTDSEVKAMLSYYNLSNKYAEIQQWYGGYNFDQEEMYNCVSIIKHISNLLENKDAQPQPYWFNHSPKEVTSEVFATLVKDYWNRDSIERLVNGKSIDCKDPFLPSYQTLFGHSMKKALLLSGYLTIKNDNQICIPNKEMFYTFIKLMEDNDYKNAKDCPINLSATLLTKDIDQIERIIDSILLYALDIFNVVPNKAKRYYMLITNSLKADLLDNWEILKDKNTDSDFSSILLINKLEKKAISIILKVAENIETMDQVFKEAQVEVINELADFEVIKYGICFFDTNSKVSLFE